MHLIDMQYASYGETIGALEMYLFIIQSIILCHLINWVYIE